jgi:hypothetical protein
MAEKLSTKTEQPFDQGLKYNTELFRGITWILMREIHIWSGNCIKEAATHIMALDLYDQQPVQKERCQLHEYSVSKSKYMNKTGSE